jgi:hypothetical protein
MFTLRKNTLLFTRRTRSTHGNPYWRSCVCCASRVQFLIVNRPKKEVSSRLILPMIAPTMKVADMPGGAAWLRGWPHDSSVDFSNPSLLL